MHTTENDGRFSQAVAALYQDLLVPLIFASYASDLVDRLIPLQPASVLELAAGTGVVTRGLAARLPPATSLVATDLNEAMLAVAQVQGTARPVDWRQADAMALPFADATFDAVVCQFGAMFFPDRAHAFAEARRVLRPGGTLLFNVWDRIETNDFAWIVTEVVAGMFPDDPPRFLARLPHGYFSPQELAHDIAGGGFTAPPSIETVGAISRADSAGRVALAYCQGTPLRGEIEARDATRLDEATVAATAALAAKFGVGPVAGRIQALVVQVAR
ncbi:class I SAM-dependent methyltransferase [Dyella sp. KULCS107]|uniref:class I SAM-dependent methyltransferase n=1 Tax=Dyella sp. KULCS107 TaxID=3422216 RepID=UPI003D6EFC52